MTPTSRHGDRLTGWSRYGRVVGFAILAGATLYGVRELWNADWSDLGDYWRAHLAVAPLILLFATLDVVFEGTAWMWVVGRFGLRVHDWTGFRIYLSANAGKLLPAQLGRLIRPDAMVRLGRGPLGTSLKAEGVVFVLDSISVVALLAGLLAWRLSPWLAVPSALAVVSVALFLGDRVSDYLADTRLDLPRGFWWNRETFGTVGVQLAGWVAHGVAFWVLVAGLPGSTTWWDALFLAPASAVFGVGTGLPGGIGATEGALGVSLSYNGVPAAYLTLAVAGFRLLTFWLWVVVGWVVLLGLRRKAAWRARPGTAMAAPDDPAQATASESLRRQAR